MKSFYRWIAEHAGLCRTLLFFILAGFTIYACTLPYVNFLTIYLMDLAVWFFVGRLIAISPAKLLQDPQKALEQDCDPYPLLEETGSQLSRKFDGTQRHLLEMDHAVALIEIGEYHKAAQMLENINIDKFPSTSPYLKFAYYLNLSAAEALTGQPEESRIWQRKSRQIFQDLPQTKGKLVLTPSFDMMEAEGLYRDGNPEDALRKVTWIQLPHPKMVVSAAMLAAKCHIALEEPEKAREKLNYVIEHGNKLHIVREAEALLQTLS